jgi:hypothetical protein
MTTNPRDSEKNMSQQQSEKHFSPRTTNILLVASVIILIASVLIRFLTTAPQEGVLALMGIGVFLFLLVAFDQPEETNGGNNASNG